MSGIRHVTAPYYGARAAAEALLQQAEMIRTMRWDGFANVAKLHETMKARAKEREVKALETPCSFVWNGYRYIRVGSDAP